MSEYIFRDSMGRNYQEALIDRLHSKAISKEYGIKIGNGIETEREFDIKCFNQNQCIEAYLALRQKYDELTEYLQVLEGCELIHWMQDDILLFGIKPELLARAMDCEPESVDTLSLILLRELQKFKVEKASLSHTRLNKKIMPEALIDYLIVQILEGMRVNKSTFPHVSFSILLRERFGQFTSNYLVRNNKSKSKLIALDMKAQLSNTDKTLSIRTMARMMRVNPSTVKRWMDEDPERNEETFHFIKNNRNLLLKSNNLTMKWSALWMPKNRGGILGLICEFFASLLTK